MRHIDLDKDYVERHKNLMNGMCEKQKRLYLGNLAIDLKYGGISAVATHFGVGICARRPEQGTRRGASINHSNSSKRDAKGKSG